MPESPIPVVEEEKEDDFVPKRIVVLLSSSLGPSQETLHMVEDSLSEQGVATTALVGEDPPEEYLDVDSSMVQVIIVQVVTGD